MGLSARQAADQRIIAGLEAWLAAAPAQAAIPPIVAAYWPIGDEPDLRPLLTRWARAGVRIALPVVARRAAPLVFHGWSPDTAMRTGDYGIPEPADPVVLTPTVILAPALGYTDDAYRVGYGGGYYDRTLAALRASGDTPIAIGIAYTNARLAASDHQPAAHDAQLDAVLTDGGWVPAAPVR